MNLTYLFTELLRRPGRTLAAVLSVAVGVALFVSLQAYAAGYRQAARAPLAQIGADIAVRVLTPNQEMKLGVLTALMGAPFLLMLILKARRGLMQ